MKVTDYLERCALEKYKNGLLLQKRRDISPIKFDQLQIGKEYRFLVKFDNTVSPYCIFEGGETVFFDSNFKQTRTVVPKRGKALMFDIDLWHKGNEVTKGQKYWIGCEIIGLNDKITV